MSTKTKELRPYHWLGISALLLLLFLAALVACNRLPTPGPKEVPTEVPVKPFKGQAVVIVDVANLRSGPGVEFEQVGTLTRGEAVTVIGMSTTDDWYLVMTPGSQAGAGQAWIWAEFVAFITPTRPPGSPAPTLTGTAVLAPTDTPMPLDTRSPTATPISLPTPRPTATPIAPVAIATPTRTPTITLAPTALATKTPPPTPGQPAVVLLEPEDGARVQGLVTFRWTWAGALGPGEIFDVRVCKGESCQPQFGKTNTGETTWVWQPSEGVGIYRWQVVVIDGASKQQKAPGSSVWEFTWNTPTRPPPTATLVPPDTPSPTATPMPLPTNTLALVPPDTPIPTATPTPAPPTPPSLPTETLLPPDTPIPTATAQPTPTMMSRSNIQTYLGQM